MLLILNDYQPDRYEYGIPDNYSGIVTPRYKQAQAIVYLRFSRETATLYTSVIPVQTLVTVEGVSMTLAEAYHHTGAQYLCDRVASMLGVGINYYVDATYDQFVALVDGSAMNGVNLNVPQDLQITLRSGTPLSLKAGTQFMDGERLLALLAAGQQKRSAWLGGVQNELAHILLEELTTLEHKRNPEGFFVSVLSGFSTNLKAELVAANAEMMFAYFDLKQEELTLPGQYNGEGEFVPDISKMAEIYRIGTALE
jgi:anionic cell wall polymer biosynthesis LytR-Cps2A-Psr (LCP) family protein